MTSDQAADDGDEHARPERNGITAAYPVRPGKAARQASGRVSGRGRAARARGRRALTMVPPSSRPVPSWRSLPFHAGSAPSPRTSGRKMMMPKRIA